MPDNPDEAEEYRGVPGFASNLGWRGIIFLPFNMLWMHLVVVMAYIMFLLCTDVVAYNARAVWLEYVVFFADTIHCVDTITATMHCTMARYRRLRTFPARHFFLLVLDYASLTPILSLYDTFYMQGDMDHHLDQRIKNLLMWNKCLRIYHLYAYFAWLDLRLTDIGMVLSVYAEAVCTNLVISHCAQCLWYWMGSDEAKQACEADLAPCKVANEVNFFSIMSHRYLGHNHIGDTSARKWIVTACMLIGFFQIYAKLLPIIFFTYLKLLRPNFENSKKMTRLTLYIKSMVTTQELKERLISHFLYAWERGTDVMVSKVIEMLPLAQRKNIFCDMYWEAMRHSEYLRDLSRTCKRDIADVMRTEFVQTNTLLMKKGDIISQMMYLAEGTLQLMAEENTDSAVMSFGPGTVLGENATVLLATSKGVLKVATTVELHVLKGNKLFSVLCKYPHDLALFRESVARRMSLARATKHIKATLRSVIVGSVGLQNMGEDLVSEDMDSIKWIKMQHRKLSGRLEHREETEKNLFDNLGHLSVYLDLLALTSGIESDSDAVCLKTRFPMLFAPASQFLMLWGYFNIFLVIYSSLTYPIFAAWYPRPPEPFFYTTLFVTLVFIIDVYIRLSTAVQTKELIVTKNLDIVVMHLQSITFYLDLVAAFPVQLLFGVGYSSTASSPGDYELGLYLCVALFKAYRIKDWLVYSGRKIMLSPTSLIMCQYIFVFFLFTYWTAAFLRITVNNPNAFKWLEMNWIDVFQGADESEPSWRASWFFALVLTGDLPSGSYFNLDAAPALQVCLVISIIGMAISTSWNAECVATYLWKTSFDFKFKAIRSSVMNFLTSVKMSASLRRRVTKYLDLQWPYDRACFLMREIPVLKGSPERLQNEVLEKTVSSYFESARLFESESSELIMDLCRVAVIFLLPNHSVITTYGSSRSILLLIRKGYVRINSFMPGDIYTGLSTPLLAGPSSMFPVVVSFAQIPSAISAVTVSDCELFRLHVEDVVKVLIKHGMFLDVVRTVKALDLTPLRKAKLALTQNRFSSRDTRPESSFWTSRVTRTICHLLVLTIDVASKEYRVWEVFRCYCITLSLFLWPLSKGYFPYIFSPLWLQATRGVLIFLDVISWFDLLVRTHVSYYKENGILVSHALHTTIHYLTTSFVTDCAACFPTLYLDPMPGPRWLCVYLSIKFLAVYRIRGCFTYLPSKEGIRQKYYFFCLLFIIMNNLAVNFRLILDAKKVDYDPYIYLEKIYSFWVILFRNEDSVNESKNGFNALIILASFIMHIAYFSLVTSMSISSNINFTIYQGRMKSLVEFLTKEEADDNIAMDAIDHFEYEWHKTEGNNVREMFENFPSIMRQEIMCPLFQKTMSAAPCFAASGDGFFRGLMLVMNEVHRMKGSEITIAQGVERVIYFVHSGECVVKETLTRLPRGSIFGDLNNEGVMVNDIVAGTHLHLLQVSSEDFFRTLNNFYEMECFYKNWVKKAKDYVSSEPQVSTMTSMDFTSVLRKHVYAGEWYSESEFIEVHANGDSLDSVLAPVVTKVRQRYLLPGSPLVSVMRFVFLVTGCLTTAILPLITVLHDLSLSSLLALICTDVIWVVKIIIFCLLAYVDPATGHLVVKRKLIVKRYLKMWHGMIPDLLSVLPVETLPYLLLNHDLPSYMLLRNYLRLNRMLRVLYVYRSFRQEGKRLNVELYKRWAMALASQLFIINLVAAFYIPVSTVEGLDLSNNFFTEWTQQQGYALTVGYYHALDIYTGTSIADFKATTRLQKLYVITVSLAAFLAQAMLGTQALSIYNVLFFKRSEFVHHGKVFANYLTARNVSPALVKTMKEYSFAMQQGHRSEHMPWFVSNSPYPLKVMIMEDLYVHHIKSCYLFTGLSPTFLKQLAARLNRQIIFPGSKITEKGEVDNRMYFIHEGEVFVLYQKLKGGIVLEHLVDLYYKNESFGELQGVSPLMAHHYTYRARTVLDLLWLDYHHWKDLRIAFPQEADIIMERARRTTHPEAINHLPMGGLTRGSL